MNYLVFRLYGPMASWGEMAVGENRHTASYPGKSAIIGLIGAALGIRRDDEESQKALAEGYAMAVKMLSAGGFLKDYHTVQTPKSGSNFHYRTRRDELVMGKERLEAILSSREYRTDALAIVAIRALDGAHWSLDQIQQALLKPKFHLYLGRKSCPLAAPLQPELIDGDGFLAAFNTYQSKPLLVSKQDWVCDDKYLKLNNVSHYYWQGALDDFADEQTAPSTQVQQLIRHDQPLSRSRWQFQLRKENFWVPPQTAGEEG